MSTHGLAAQILGTTLLFVSPESTGDCVTDENLDPLCYTPAFALLSTSALLRGIGMGLATFGWGGQSWLKHGSGRVPRKRRSRVSR